MIADITIKHYIKMDIHVQGRFTKFPGKVAIINDLNNGKKVKLRVERDSDGHIVLVDCITDEPAGCIPQNPSYLHEYAILSTAVDRGFSRFVDVDAIEACSNNRHYRAVITIPYLERTNQ